MRGLRTTGQKMHVVSLENPATVQDAWGGYTETWAPCTPADVYAAIEPATARDLERMTSGAVVATASHLVTIDFHPEVTIETRLHFGTRVFDIAALHNPDERNLELVLACTEQLGAQPA